VPRPFASTLALVIAMSAPAWGLVWPDQAERVERDMSAADPATRRAAAREIRALGPGRGTSVAIAALDDPDDEVRLLAAEAAIRLRAEGATDIVVSWLNAREPRLRREACEVARALPSPRAVAPLGRTLGDPDPEVRAAAAEALGHQASPDAVPPLLGRLDDPAPAVRIEIVSALARLGDGRAVVPLVGKVEDSSPDVRQAVARALGDLADPRAWSALVLSLRDQSIDVRRETLAALGRMHASDAVDAITSFATDRTPALRLAALEALGRIATPDAVRVLLAVIGTGDDGSGSLERTPLRDALVASGPAVVTPLCALLAGSPSPQAATSAAWVLGELHARSGIPSIVSAMRRGALPTAAALRALAGAGTGAQVPVVLEFVADPSPVVRAQALAAAMALLDPVQPDGRAVEPLAAALRDARSSAEDRVRIATLLGRTGAPRAAALLMDLARAKDASLRLAAIDALGTLGPADGPLAQARDPGLSDALLEALESPDAVVRLHAAIALSEAGTSRARDVLLSKLDGGDEVDRAAVLTALGGVLTRAPSEASVAKLVSAFGLAAGPERDAIMVALGLAALPSAVRALGRCARSEEREDRRTVAAMCAAHAGDPARVAIARSLLSDADPSVRAEAAWSLGTIGDAADFARLETVARATDVGAAANATAALGRLAARLHAGEAASRVLCPVLADPRPYVRANALAGLGLARARCQDGSRERALLIDDPRDEVRAAAALAVAQRSSDADSLALNRCAHGDPSANVAAHCRSRGAPEGRTHATLVYVIPEGSNAPHPGAPYAILFADGTVRSGTADRRGALFDPVAPEGDVTLLRASAR
jgi:cellulose synthase operon protein C